MAANSQGQQAAWPEGVIARYATVGGATVDVGEFGANRSDQRAASCTGCGREDSFNGDPCLYGLDEDVCERNSLVECRRWAQKHAESCRAMPRPDGEVR